MLFTWNLDHISTWQEKYDDVREKKKKEMVITTCWKNYDIIIFIPKTADLEQARIHIL